LKKHQRFVEDELARKIHIGDSNINL
jgi:hypothetical protein